VCRRALKIRAKDRDRYLKREWGSVDLFIPGELAPIPVNIDKASMWDGTCRELIHIKIKAWFIRTGKYPWTKGSPPRVRLIRTQPKSFALSFV
jgi:hypothetical protein